MFFFPHKHRLEQSKTRENNPRSYFTNLQLKVRSNEKIIHSVSLVLSKFLWMIAILLVKNTVIWVEVSMGRENTHYIMKNRRTFKTLPFVSHELEKGDTAMF